MTNNNKPAHTPEQIAAMRKMYDVPENFVPVTHANGVVSWITKAAAGLNDENEGV